MNRGKAAFDRIITFLLFLVFTALAVWGIGLAADAPFAHRISDYADRDFWRTLPDRENYEDILRITALVLLVLGLLLIMVNIERKRLGRTTSPASGTAGLIQLHPADLASAVAQSLEHVPGVRSATCRAIQDRSTDVLEIRMRTTAEVDIAALREACSTAAADIAAALPGLDIRPRFLLQADQVHQDS
ncbi:hypothetical protein [Corynebacterium terpenotabidum]|uniref:Alkaline shock response membrane anchor protein AmaP n=1 Tax=Corynebacterium terpenotabidum Y-11 TaxID=1200352 RepID=S4XEP5_9CORY|nr:hypothetical protein [Corynebacterium terpenotabidum]AGP31617.1 hypothetical protein A606_09890 [Corynebacterium terpenotabidum Y-11]